MDLKEKLQRYIKKVEESPDYVPPEQRDAVEERHFESIYKPALVATETSYKSIPKFYHKLPTSEDVLGQKLREEARALFVQKKNKELLDNVELKHLWSLLGKGEMLSDGEDYYLSYSEFKKIGERAEDKYKNFFTATVFAKLECEQQGCVLVDSLFNYVMRKIWFNETRISLSVYDSTGQGYLREHDLDKYIEDLAPTLPALDGLDASFDSFYVCTAARKFLFFLDPLRTGRVRIIDILASNFLDDLAELHEKDLPKEVQDKNWFSVPSTLRVYGQYLNLDRNHNGMLSLDELQGYGSGTLTRVFLSRVFQQSLTYDGEMDYKTYLELVLALEYRQEPQSLHYLFRVLDIHGLGYLDGFTLNFFFKAIQEQMVQHGTAAVSFEDVKDEIFDMVRPKNPTKITLNDLINSGHGGTVVSILIEFQCFFTYEHREALVANSPDFRL